MKRRFPVVCGAGSLLCFLGCSDEPYQGPAGGVAGTAGAAAGAGAGGGGAAGMTTGGSSSGVAGLTGSAAGAGGSSGSAGTAGSGGSGGALASGGASGGGAGGAAGAGGSGGSGGDPNMGGLEEGQQTARPKGQPYAKNGYWEYLPQHYGNGFKRPLLVFWAGVGENGDGSADALNVIVERHGPPKLIAQDQWPEDRPFIVLSPQHGTETDRPSADELHDFFTFAIDYYDVDPERVYLTGLSTGARGTYGYLGKYKGEQVAAAVPIAGDSTVAWDAGGCSVVSAVPIWAFHGENDGEVPFSADTEGMNHFKACPEPREEVLYTTYPNTGHVDSWPKTYDLSAGHDIYAWMLTKKR